MLSKFLGVSIQIEVTLIILLAICMLYFDTSVSHLHSNLEEVWNYNFHENIRRRYSEIYLKYILAGVIILRSFTSYIFLALYIVLLWPIIFQNKPNLILPWLIVGSIRCIFLNVITLTTGCYICWIQKGYDAICIDLILAQILDHGPSMYAWYAIYSFYKKLKSNDEFTYESSAKSKCTSKVNLIDAVMDGRNVITESTITNLINHLRKIKPLLSPSRSLDALLEGKSSTKLWKMDSFVNAKCKTIPERVMCLLNVVNDDINRAKMEQEERSSWIMNNIKIDNISNKELTDFRSNRVWETLIIQDNHGNDKNISSNSAHDDAIKEGTTNEIELQSISLESSISCSKSSDRPNITR